MKLWRPLVCGVLLAMAGLFLTGCGYHSGFLIPADVHTVHIRVVGNDTFWHEAVKSDNLPGSGQPSSSRPAYTMELELTERIKNEVVRRTPLKIAPEERADSILEATIRKVEPGVLVRDVNNNVSSGRVTIIVDFTWRDRRTGRIHAEGKNIARPTDFVVTRGETLTSATRTSFDYIADQIIEQMQESF